MTFAKPEIGRGKKRKKKKRLKHPKNPQKQNRTSAFVELLWIRTQVVLSFFKPEEILNWYIFKHQKRQNHFIIDVNKRQGHTVIELS